MSCPSCGAPVVDNAAAFCARCGAPLASGETEATEKIEVPAATTEATTDTTSGGSTTEIRPPADTQSDEPAPLLSEYKNALQRRFLASWLDPIAAACLAFLVLLGLGAVLLIAAKLQYPGFGAGANPVEILTAISILGLAVMRVPIHVEDLVVSVLPLGALLAAGVGIAWATSVTLRGNNRRVLRGAAVGVPFALVCWIAALVFRFGGKGEVFAGAWGAFFWALIWGSVFGALGSLRGTHVRRTVWAAVTEARGTGVVRRGLTAAFIALATAAAVGAVVTLLWLTVALLRGAPGPRFGGGDAAAAFVYLLAFAPNVFVTLTSLGMGAPVYIGARVTVAGSAVGDVDRVWLFGEAPGYAGFLILIPLLACSLAGFWARRSSERKDMVAVLGTFAVSFALSMALLAWLGEARLGGSLLGKGLARLDVNAPATFLAALVWAAVAGLGGWFLADRAPTKEKQ